MEETETEQLLSTTTTARRDTESDADVELPDSLYTFDNIKGACLKLHTASLDFFPSLSECESLLRSVQGSHTHPDQEKILV